MLRPLHAVFLFLISSALMTACGSASKPETGSTDSTDAADGADASDGADATDMADVAVDASADVSTPGDATDGAEEVSVPVDEGTSPADLPEAPPDIPAPPIEASYITSTGEWKMKPGAEHTRCVVRRLDNLGEIWVSKIQTKLAKGSHHLIIYKSDDTEEQPEPFKCTPFTDTLGGDTVPLMISQIAEEEIALPTGVAYKFGPKQMIRLEAHFLNYYPEEINAQAEVTFHTLAADDVEHEANILFYGTPDFDVPPQEEYSNEWFFLDVPAGSKVFAVTGHTHQWGTNVEIEYAATKDASGEAVYPLGMPYLWDEAPVIQYDPPLEFPTGKEGFHYRCSWFNQTKKSVGFGESADTEMCFFWAYYYPSQGYRICINPGSMDPTGGTLGEQICCPGSFVCDLIKDYLINGF